MGKRQFLPRYKLFCRRWARLLQTDLNTLLSFNEDLTDLEIENFINEVDEIAREKGYEAAFAVCLDKIHEYPTCDFLLYSLTLYLQGALFLYDVQEDERYNKELEKFYQRLAESENAEIKNMSIGMLISYNRNRGDYDKAEELIKSLPASWIDRQEQFAILYMKQEKYGEAEKIWEHRVMQGVTNIQTALINMLDIALRKSALMMRQFLPIDIRL